MEEENLSIDSKYDMECSDICVHITNANTD